MARNVWQTAPCGTLAAETDRHRLTVKLVGGWTRYTVTRRDDGVDRQPPVLLASGSVKDTQAAMDAAEMAAARIATAGSGTYSEGYGELGEAEGRMEAQAA